MKRRAVLTALPLAVAGLSVSGRLLAAPAGSAKLLVVFLRGGYDCANALVPYASPFYYESRPTIAIRAGAAEDPSLALPLDASWALAPALKPAFGPLWLSGELAILPFAGTDDLSRSHFETQDDIELGLAANAGHRFGSGFMARLATELTGARPIAFTSGVPMTFAGLADVPSIAVREAGRIPLDPTASALYRELYRGTPLEGAVNEGLNLRAEVAADLAQEMKDAGRKGASARGFANDAARIGTLMKDGYSLGFVDLGGWDTHVNEGGADGALARNLASLGDGLLAFKTALGSDWAHTTVVVLSEFGRTFRENGNHGTDHGHGSVYFVLGGGVRGGRIVGRQVAVARGQLFQDRDYPVLNNYRDVLGGLFASQFGLSARAINAVFPGAKPQALGLV